MTARERKDVSGYEILVFITDVQRVYRINADCIMYV